MKRKVKKKEKKKQKKKKKRGEEKKIEKKSRKKRRERRKNRLHERERACILQMFYHKDMFKNNLNFKINFIVKLHDIFEKNSI